MAGSMLKRKFLAAYLRDLRLQSGESAAKVGAALGIGEGTMSRIENNKTPPSAGNLALLLNHYGVDPDGAASVIELGRAARTRGWWRKYASVLPEWFEYYVGLESEAVRIEGYEAGLIPGLLQTEGYCRAMFQTNARADDEAIEKWVSLRIERQKHVTAGIVWFVIDEAVLARPVGTPEVWRAQLTRLVHASEGRTAQIQILPFEKREHPSVGKSYTILRFDEQEFPGVVYLENGVGTLYMEEPAEIEIFTETLDHLRASALGTRESLEFLRERISSIK